MLNPCLQNMVKANSLPFHFDASKPGRIGLLRRDSAPGADGFGAVQWFEVPGPGFMAFHVAAAWQEENGSVKVGACGLCPRSAVRLHAARQSVFVCVCVLQSEA